MKYLSRLIPVLLTLSLLACTSSTKREATDWATVDSEKFTVEIPSFLKKASNLHEEAIVQYQNPVKEFYFIVIQESAATFHAALETNELTESYSSDLDGYANLLSDRFSETTDETPEKSAIQSTTLRGKEARYFEASGKIDGIDIYYHYGFVKGDTTYYQLVSWTLKERKQKFSEDMLGIFQSFKEKQ